MNAAPEHVINPEAGPLAREMAAGLRELVESYRWEYGLSTPEAAAQVRDDQPEREQDALQRPPTEVSWADLEALLERDPQRFLQRWEEIKGAAREELQTGHRASGPVEVYGSTPWDRARFLALRQELADGWQPRNGVERQLVDAMAQAQAAVEYWLDRLMSKAAREARLEQATLREKGTSELSRATGFQAVEQAGAMVDRFNRIFLRTLRALRDLRRGPQPVFVQNAGQVNVARQQVNVAQEAGGRNGDAVDPVPDVIGRRIAALPNGHAGPDTAGGVAGRGS
jgi:hypothetical protein